MFYSKEECLVTIKPQTLVFFRQVISIVIVNGIAEKNILNEMVMFKLFRLKPTIISEYDI